MNIAKATRQEKKLAGNVKVAFNNGSKGRLRSTVRDYVNSYSARLVAAAEAVDSCKRKTHKDVLQIAREMNVWRFCDERVDVNVAFRQVPPQRGQNAQYDIRARVTLSFGPENQARQILVRNVLKAMWRTSQAQTMLDGGRTRAARLVQDFYAEGYQHTLEADIYRCFPSFDNRGIGNFLCLPEKVTRHVLGASSLNLHPSRQCRKEVLYHSPSLPCTPMEQFMEMFGEDWDPAQLGLIEGSKASPFAAELLLAPVCEALTKSGLGRVVNYADNFVLMAKSKSELKKLTNILRKGLHTHPAGPLQVKDLRNVTKPQMSFEFLGYKFLPAGDCLRSTWGEKAETKARKLRMYGHRVLTSGMPIKTKQREFDLIRQKHCGIVGAFPEWREGKSFHQTKIRALGRHLKRNTGATT